MRLLLGARANGDKMAQKKIEKNQKKRLTFFGGVL